MDTLLNPADEPKVHEAITDQRRVDIAAVTKLLRGAADATILQMDMALNAVRRCRSWRAGLRRLSGRLQIRIGLLGWDESQS